MPSHININHTYDASSILEVFNNAEKYSPPPMAGQANIATLGSEAYNDPLFAPFFDKFPFIPKNDLSIDLLQLTGNQRPHINPGNNGLLIFPLDVGFILNTYSYQTTTVDDAGRPTMNFGTMTVADFDAIETTLIESVMITTPVAIDGLTTFSMHLDGGTPPTLLVLKIDKTINWSTVYNYCKSML